MGNNVFQSPYGIISAAILAALGYAPVNKAGDTMTGSLFVGTTNALGVAGRLQMKASADGVATFTNISETDFGRLNFGGSTSSFPAIKRYPSAALFQFRTADDSAFVGMELKHARLGSHTVAAIGTSSGAGAGSLFYVTDATATTRQSVVAGGGSNKVLVYSDGTNWLIV